MRCEKRIPIVKVESFGVGTEVNPDRQQMRHPIGIGLQRVETGLLPRRIKRRHDAIAGLDRANGTFGFARATTLVVFTDAREETLPVAFEKVLRARLTVYRDAQTPFDCLGDP